MVAEQYPVLAAEIAAGLELLSAARQAAGHFSQAAANAAHDDDVQVAGVPGHDLAESARGRVCAERGLRG